MSWKAAAGLRLPEATAEVLASLGEHRVLSTAQVRSIHFPDRSIRRTQQALAYVERAGLVAYAEARRAPRRLWFLTERGADYVLDAGEVERRPKVLAPAQAAGPLRAHTSPSTRLASASCARRARGATSSVRSPGGMRWPTPSTVAAAALAAR